MVAIGGSGGMIGTALVVHLAANGHTVRRLVRASRHAQPGDIAWDPSRGALDARLLEGCDAIVNLGGVPIAQRWTTSRKRAILESRIGSTATLARAIRAMKRPPRVMLSGSAIGIYGSREDEMLDERSTLGNDFLASVAREWETAAAPVLEAGVRLVLLRTGIVLAPTGGALARLLPVFRLGAGGAIGTGQQWMSWISLHDHVRAMEHAIVTQALGGAVNLVSPSPVTNAEFTEVLARVLHRPAFVHVPRIAVELLLGEMGTATVLASQRVQPAALVGSGFRFADSRLETALTRELPA